VHVCDQRYLQSVQPTPVASATAHRLLVEGYFQSSGGGWNRCMGTSIVRRWNNLQGAAKNVFENVTEVVITEVVIIVRTFGSSDRSKAVTLRGGGAACWRDRLLANP
jgi:hypothetical protein